MGYGTQVRTVLDGRQPLGYRYRALRTSRVVWCTPAECADTYINRLGYFRPDERTALLDTITALQTHSGSPLASLLTYSLLADSKE